MKLTWVNHASFLLDTGEIRLITDPWFEGTAFNNGWRLMSPTRMTYDDFATVTHIWFSHEHPDHFSPPNLKKIPEAIRRRITVLFHETRDKRVVNVCRAMGFAIQELPDRKPVQITNGFSAVCGINELIDSWIAINANGTRILNLNDCVFPTERELTEAQDAAGGPVDLLLSQFSYANWVGNPDDVATHRAHALRKREEMATQIRHIKPKQFIPFASYVYFCHSENFFMNRSVNKIDDVYRFLVDELKQESVVLYPDDSWEIGTKWDSSVAIQNYEADFKMDMSATPGTSAAVALSELQKAMGELAGKCFAKNNPLVLKSMPVAVVHLSDIKRDVEISFRRGIRETRASQTKDLVLSSDSLMYCIKTDWGGETLKINGRYQVPQGGNPERFFRLFRVPQYNGYGDTVNLRFSAGKVFDAVRRRAHL
jgi:UDP-MurNAc hydroxylase